MLSSKKYSKIKMDTIIQNIDDLRNEISRLKGLEQQQSAAIAQRFRSPGAILTTLVSLVTGNSGGSKVTLFDQDIVGLISRIVLPFTLNKTIFRKSGFIVKTLVSVLSQRASTFITEDGVVSLWEKAKGLFTKNKEHESQHEHEHRGVPPLSEAS
jgi:hypothetical protein